MMAIAWIETKKATEMQAFWCDECDQGFGTDGILGPWPISKSYWLHRNGCPTHHLTRLKLGDE
jgi:hypothetical protein